MMTSRSDEHKLDRLIRVHKETNRVIRWEPHSDDGFCWITGKTSTKRWNFETNPRSLFVDCECQIFGKRGNGKSVKSCYLHADPIGPSFKGSKVFSRLCNRCRMTLENLTKKYRQYEEMAVTARRIQRKLNESTKNNARAS